MTFGTFTSSSEPMMAIRRAVRGFIAIAVIPVSLVNAATSKEPSKNSTPVCPREIPLRDITVKWPAGWEGEVDTVFRLNSVTVIQSEEANHEGDIIPEGEKRKGKAKEIFSGLDGYIHPRWLSCNYGHHDVLRLYKRLPSNVKQCVIQYDKDGELESYRCE